MAERRKQLAELNLISQSDYIDTLDELQYNRNRREVTIESQEQDELMRQAQIESLESGVEQLERNLDIARRTIRSEANRTAEQKNGGHDMTVMAAEGSPQSVAAP